jgi:hypothetical protein
MNNNFDELILKRHARGRARTASMGTHVSWGAKGGRECLGGVDGGCERGGTNGRGARGARGPWGVWGRERGGAWAVGRARPRVPTHVGAPRPWAPTAEGRLRARPPLEARTGRARPRATWLVGARTYAPSNGGVHASSEEGINGVTLLISRCQVFSSLLLA